MDSRSYYSGHPPMRAPSSFPPPGFPPAHPPRRPQQIEQEDDTESIADSDTTCGSDSSHSYRTDAEDEAPGWPLQAEAEDDGWLDGKVKADDFSEELHLASQDGFHPFSRVIPQRPELKTTHTPRDYQQFKEAQDEYQQHDPRSERFPLSRSYQPTWPSCSPTKGGNHTHNHSRL